MEPESNIQPDLTASMDSSPPLQQTKAAYGKACLSCSKVKAKCVISNTGGKCERCNRLNKDCQPAGRRKRVSKKPVFPNSATTAALEKKLDGIYQILHHSQRSSGMPPLADANDLSLVTADSPSLSDPSREKPRSSRQDEAAVPQIPPISSVPDKPDFIPDYAPESEAELVECLESYRNEMVSYFPVVCIGAEITAVQLKEERPFLHLVIRAICSKNLWRQAVLILQVKKVLGREMLLEGEKSLDLFLGVLVFASWSHFHICNKPIVSTVMQLGISLAFDLGLMRPLPVGPVNPMLHSITRGQPRPPDGTPLARSMEERRAAVGIYFLSSVSASYFRRSESLRWTSYLEECIRLLEDVKEYPTDSLLVFLTKVQLIDNQAVDSASGYITGETNVLPAGIYSKILTSQLDDLKSSIPVELQSNSTLQLHILNTTLSIHEYSLTANDHLASSDPTAKVQRIEGLWVCLETVKAWFNTFFSLEAFPLSCYLHLSMAIFSQLARCLVTLYSLSTFAAVGVPWDRQRVAQELNLGAIIKLIADRWELVLPAAGIEQGSRQSLRNCNNGQIPEDPWSNTKKKVSDIGKWWEAKVAAMYAADLDKRNGVSVDSSISQSAEQPEQQDVDNMFEYGPVDMEMVNDNWLRDLMGGGYDFNLAQHF